MSRHFQKGGELMGFHRLLISPDQTCFTGDNRWREVPECGGDGSPQNWALPTERSKH